MNRCALMTMAALLCTSIAQRAQADVHAHEVDAPAQRQQPWGIRDEPARATRTVEIVMLDAMHFKPDVVDVKSGDTVRFVVRNAGKLPHELVIGTKQSLDRHAKLMAKGAHAAHDEPSMVEVPPGSVGELTWTFNRGGRFDFGCLIPGHYEAGMVGRINVGAR